MDYLYINAIVKEVYKDLPCGCSFPADYSKILYSTISGQDCLSNPDITNVISGFTLRAKNQEPVIVLSSVRRHTNSASVGRFIQCIGWTWNSDLFMQNLDEVLGVGFYSEEEINTIALRNGNFPLPKNRCSEYREIPISMSSQVKRAVLNTIMLRWMRFDAPLRIAVPKNVDYNDYVISAVRQIYSLLPVSLRARAGFCSYLPSNKDVPEAIFIGFVPEDMADSRTLSLDGSSPAACNKLASGTDNTYLDTFIRYISSTSEENRQGFFREILKELEDSGSSKGITSVAVRDFQNIGVALDLMTISGPLEELIPQWDKIFFEKQENFTPVMQRRIRAQIKKTINHEAFCDLFRNRCRRPESDVLSVLHSFRNYCLNDQELCGKVWDTAISLLEENMNSVEIHSLVSKRAPELEGILEETRMDQLLCCSVEEQLRALQAKPAEDLQTVRDRIEEAKNLRTVLQDAPQSQGTAALLEKIRMYGQGMNTKFNWLKHVQRSEEFEQICKLPADTVVECQRAIEQAKKLADRIGQVKTPTADDQSLLEAVLAFIRQKEAFINSSDAKFQAIEDIFANTPGYFRILKELERADKSQLEARHEDTIRSKLEMLCPKTLESYGELFEEQLRKPLVLANVAILPDYVCGIIIRDICRLNRINLRCAGKGRARDTAEMIEGALYTAGKISETCEVAVAYDNEPVNSLWFKKLLRLTHDARSMGDAGEFKRVFEILAEKGAFTADDMIPALEMLIRCKVDLTWIFDDMIRGVFRDGTPAQYRAAYELILSSSEAKPQDVLDYLTKIAHQQSIKDKVAYRAFQEFLRAHAPRENDNGKKLMPVVYAMGAVILVLLAVIIFMIVKNFIGSKDPSNEPTTSPTTGVNETLPIDPDIVYPEEFLFFGQEAAAIEALYGNEELSFRVRSQVVESLLDNADPELSATVLANYTANRGTTVQIDEKGTEVRWEEAFFWNVWYHADADSTVLMDVLGKSEISEDVLSVLRVIHHSLPAQDFAPTIPAETEPEVTEPAATEPAGTEADASEPAGTTEPVGTTAPAETEPAETEPPLTMEDVKVAVTEAAQAPYAASMSYAEELILIRKLFGAEFQLSFQDHVDKVASLKLAEDPRSAKYQYFIKHYTSLPGDSVIRFSGISREITWNEYVFWECWLLADRGVVKFNENTFDGNLHDDVVSILSLIYGLVEESEFPANLEELLEAAAQSEAEETAPTEAPQVTEATEAVGEADETSETTEPTDSTEPATEATEPVIVLTAEEILLQEIFEGARTSYERAQAIYQVIYDQVKAS